MVLLGAACAGLAALHADNNPLDDLKDIPASITCAQLLATAQQAALAIVLPLHRRARWSNWLARQLQLSPAEGAP